ncbi:asparagine synthase (glutamine-hydrolyzing) [Azospirillum sp. sgz302134]
MCGIAGFIDRTAPRRPLDLEVTAYAMADTLFRRGPDGDGVWTDAAAGVALAHRRLAILDLSPAGRQPMESMDGRFVVTFNGEIYNFPELRAELEALGHRFRGHSDTEVLVEGASAWGVERLARRLVGMFAFALWDRGERRLTLVRDQVGIKPLYWGRFGSLFLFGSELKALAAHPAFPREVDRGAVASFLRLGYVPTPFSVYKDVHKLAPGTLLHLEADGSLRTETYWDALAVARRGIVDRDTVDEREAFARVEALLSESVRRQMVSDVPLGAFLSGGVDSSLVVALMQAQSSRPIRSFSIGFDDPAFNEAPYARAVAEHLGTDHSELYVGPAHLAETIPTLPEHFDEPFADASQVATLLLSEMTSNHVTVALSGDGGDELFGGYGHVRLLSRLWPMVARVPLPAQRALATAALALPGGLLNRLAALTPERPGRIPLPDRLIRTAQLLPAARPDDLYRARYSHWTDPGAVVLGAEERRGVFWDEASDDLPDFIDRMQWRDQTTYMADDVLPKVDRASMAVSLEARVPLLDHRLVELAWMLPRSMKIRGGTGKWILREILYKHVPRALVDRPKNGFNPPVAAWMRGPLRDWAESLMAEDRLRRDGFLDPAQVRPVWARFLRGEDRPWDAKRLWDVLMFQAWADAHLWERPPAVLPAARHAALHS